MQAVSSNIDMQWGWERDALSCAGTDAVGQLKLCDFGFARQLPEKNVSITDYVSTRQVS